jgi:pectin methylesterase-like acyl-CoA thioesterase
MAVLRNGVALLMVLVAAACVVSAVTAQDCDCTAPATDDCSWECYITWENDRQNSVSTESTDSTVTTSSVFPAIGYTITVDSKGSGNFKTIQAAVNSIANGNTKRIIIKILDGTYRY